jgi:diguanylate cyclase (GGDEF)-like protein
MEKLIILIVEDEGLISMDLKMRLEEMGHKVLDIASSGEEAIAIVQTQRPDLVLMDIVLQGMLDGIKACVEICASYDTPVIYLTSHADEKTLSRAIATRPYGYILKPIDEKELSINIEIAMQKHRLIKTLKQLAFVDTLTGLPNETSFLKYLEQSCKHSKQRLYLFAVLYIGVNNFASVNELFGYEIGDLLLKEIAQRLSACVESVNIVSRIRSAEFAIIISKLGKTQQPDAIAEDVIRVMQQDFDLNGHICSISVNIGINIAPTDCDSPLKILKCTAEAMYEAKAKGMNSYAVCR